MNFKNYYEAAQQIFKYRVKSIYKLDDESMDIIEGVFEKYRPNTMTKPKKMMFQTNPLGFTGVKNVELYYFDIEATVPATSKMLTFELNSAFGFGADSAIIQVSSEEENPVEVDPIEIEHKEALLLDPTYKEADDVNPVDYFGDEYNSKFLTYLKKVEAERQDKKKIDAPHPITKWADQLKQNEDIDTTDYNTPLRKSKVK